MKRDRDNTDFGAMALHYKDRDSNCVFCEIEANRITLENEFCYAIHDKYPVSPYHTLIIPKRHISDFFELHQPEINAAYASLTSTHQICYALMHENHTHP